MRWQVALFCLALVLVGCGVGRRDIPETIVEPERVGEIIDVTQSGDAGGLTVDLSDGTVDLPADAIELYGRLSAGNLFVSGEVDGESWWAAFSSRETEDGQCYALISSSAVDDGSAILFPLHDEYGLRLEKSSDFDPGRFALEGDRYRGWLDTWCVDLDGHVESVHESGSG